MNDDDESNFFLIFIFDFSLKKTEKMISIPKVGTSRLCSLLRYFLHIPILFFLQLSIVIILGKFGRRFKTSPKLNLKLSPHNSDLNSRLLPKVRDLLIISKEWRQLLMFWFLFSIGDSVSHSDHQNAIFNGLLICPSLMQGLKWII